MELIYSVKVNGEVIQSSCINRFITQYLHTIGTVSFMGVPISHNMAFDLLFELIYQDEYDVLKDVELDNGHIVKVVYTNAFNP